MKGNQIEEITIKRTRISQFDEFFSASSQPLKDLVNWNNELDDMLFKFREIGMDIRSNSSVEGSQGKGTVSISVTDHQVSLVVMTGDAVVPVGSLDKVSKERFNLVQKKIKLLNSRILTLRKREGFTDATLRVKSKDKTQVELVADRAMLENNSEEDDVIDMKRSLLKFNNRTSLLVMQLLGNLTLKECVSALLNTMKEELIAKGKEIKLAIEDGMPKIDGLPESIQDFVPELIARGWELFKQLLDYLSELKDNVPALQPKIESSMKEAQDLFTQAKDLATNSGLGAMEAVKAIKAAGDNIKALGRAPEIAKILSSTLSDTLLEIAGVFTDMGSKDENKK
jgi:hypothetical protein